MSGNAEVRSARPAAICAAEWTAQIAVRRAGFKPALLFCAFLAVAASAFAEPDKNDPAAELASFKLPPGFEANLFASEKDGVIKPIQIRWDTRGRLWVIGSTTYPQLKPGEEPNDKVLILEDTDGNGVCDKTTVFADGLMIPTGLEIAPSTGNQSAAYIGESPKLWLMTDTDGDGKADKKEVVLRGFGTGDNHQNINSFRWSPGGELFFSQGLHGHARIETPYGIVPLDEAGFWRFRPREQRLDSFYGGPAEPQNPWGFVWTDWGQMLMVAGNNGGIYYALPEMIRGYRYGKRDQIWENARGRKTSGPDIVGTAHLPDEWQGRFITGGYINNAVWTMAIEDDGAGFKLTDREPLITSTDGSFRPVDVKVGPDGAIYICDWYNPIIGHYQASFRHPDRDKTHGRIWRVTYKGRPLVKPPQIAGAPLGELFENLKSNERWVREQSKRELAGRETAEVVKAARAWYLGLLKDYLSGDLWQPHQTDKATERALFEILTVFETHQTPDFELLEVLMKADDPGAQAYAAGVFGRWYGSMELASKISEGKVYGPLASLDDLARSANLRVRCAAVVASANVATPESLASILLSPASSDDRFVGLATRAALAVLQPHLVMLLDTGIPGTEQTWRQRFANLQNSITPSRSAAPRATQSEKFVPLPATGKLRATPEFLADLVREVKEQGDAKRGAEIFRRAELACTTCHSIADQGGKIGPPLDTIGSGQPLDFIIGAVLEPQREIKESYEAMQLTGKDGRVAVGYISARDPNGTTIRDPGTGAETKFAAADIAEQKPLGSFMPAGLVDNLPRADLRDLFRYLSELGKPTP